jgi:DNA polymerase-1
MQNLYIIDAAGYSYRSYFAIRNMTNAKGESTNSLYGFARSVLKFIKDFNPEHCIAVFDGKNNAQSRTAIYPAYKAHRQVMPPDLLHQIQWAKEFCRLIGISILDPEGVEADDTIGSIALYAAELGLNVNICSTDKDLCQLVTDKISMLDTYKDNLKVGPAEVKEKFGVPPSLIVDYLALIGDASDNIPGVPGIGPKTAADLLNSNGSLDALYNNLDAITGKKKDLLRDNKELALISRKLATLHLDVEFPREENFFLIKPTLTEELKVFYNGMQFHTLIKELSLKEAPEEKIKDENCFYTLVDDEDSLKGLVDKLQKEPELCIHTKTTHTHPMLAELVGVALGYEAKNAWYIPLNGQLGKEKVLEALKQLFDNPMIGFYGHNIKYDYHVLKNAGIPILNIAFDTHLASYLLNTHSKRHLLDDLSLEHFGFMKTEPSSLIGKGKTQITMKEVPIDKAAALSCEDTDYTIRLKNLFTPQITERGFTELYYGLELPLLKVLADMEQAGIFLDVVKLADLKAYLTTEIAKLSLEIFALAGEEFNLNSPLQLSKILFGKLGLPSQKGESTGAEILEELKWEYPIAGKIQEYRILEKLRSTYVDTLPQQINPHTGRIHCTFNQTVAATGRLSCQDPNLQNIPVRTDVGLRIREAFKPEKPDSSYVAADYSQIELRLLAHLSEDPVLVSAFQNNEDIHNHTASVVFHVPIEEVTKDMRSKAKAVNFGIIYGQGSYGLSQAIGITQKEAGAFIAQYFEQYPKVKQFLESCKDSARLSGKSVTLTGRERLIPEILSKNVQIRNAAERLAVNTPFQGSAADLIKMAMLHIASALEVSGKKGYMILQVHDELIFEVPDDEVDYFKALIKDKMENVIKLNVPLIVDVEVGKNWKAC